MKWLALVIVSAFTGNAYGSSDTGPTTTPVVNDGATNSTPNEGRQLTVRELDDMDLSALLENVQVFESEYVVVSATRDKVQSTEAPSIVTVIPRATILARGYRSVGEALVGVPGLYVLDDLVTSNVGIRGIYGAADSWSRVVKVMVDGVPVTYHATGGTLLGPELIPMDSVEAIEIIRGPASALYGANAFLGVINIITRGPTETNALEVSADGGYIRDNPSGSVSAFASVASSGPHPASFVAALYAGRADRSGLSAPEISPRYEVFSTQQSERDLSRPLSILARGVWDADKLGSFTIRYMHQRLDAKAEFSDIGVLTHKNRIVISNTVARVDYSNKWQDGAVELHGHAELAMGQDLPENRLQTPNSAFRRQRRNTARDGGADLSYKNGPHSVLVGMDYLFDQDRGDTVYQLTAAGDESLVKRGQRSDYKNLGLYAQGITYFSPGVGLTLGTRYDKNSVWDDTFNIRAAIVFHIYETVHIKTLFGTSYVPPSPTQLHAEPLRFGMSKGNPDLKSQTANTFEGSVSYQLADHLNLSANGYWTNIRNRIEAVSFGAHVVPQNLTASQTIGAEAVAEALWSLFFVQANASWQSTTVSPPKPPTPSWWLALYDPKGEGEDRPPAMPVLMGHLTLGATLPSYHLQASLSMHLVGSRKSSQANVLEAGHAYVLPAYWTIDANLRSLELRLWGDYPTELSLHFRNITNHQYVEGGALGVEIPSLGREVYLRIGQSF